MTTDSCPVAGSLQRSRHSPGGRPSPQQHSDLRLFTFREKKKYQSKFPIKLFLIRSKLRERIPLLNIQSIAKGRPSIHRMLSFRFYFPNGNPSGKLSVDGVCKKFSEAFSKNKQSSVTTEQLGHTLKVSPACVQSAIMVRGERERELA